MSQSVIIVGSGPIGLFSAFEFASTGFDVTVIDGSTVGSGGSRWNAGEIVPGEVDPVASKHFLLKGARGLLAPRSEPSLNVGIRDTLSDPGFFARFAWNARSAQYERGRAELVEFARPTFQTIEKYRQSGLRIDYQGTRFLYIFGSPRAAHVARDGAYLASKKTGLDSPGRILNAKDLRDFEPGLSSRAVAGYFQTGNAYLDAQSLSDNLIAHLRNLGVRFVENTAVQGIIEHEESVEARTPMKTFEADHLVIAAGVGSADLAKIFDVNLPLRAGRGYSIRVGLPLQNRDTLLHFSEAHVVASPFDSEVQLAGQMDLTKNPRSESAFHERISSMATEFLPEVATARRIRAGGGVRPLTPDGLPYIGKISQRVHVNAGHNMLGLTLAPQSAKATLQSVLQSNHQVLTPFSPHRFTPGA